MRGHGRALFPAMPTPGDAVAEIDEYETASDGDDEEDATVEAQGG